MRFNSMRVLLLGASAITAPALLGGQAWAQAASTGAAPARSRPALPAEVPAAGTTNVGEIVVQARRRSESLIDVPLSISVVTRNKLEQLDIKNTTELANFTPGLTFNSFTTGDARNDRGPDRPLIIRGLNLGIGGQQGATLFLDGAAVAGNEVAADMDVGQVEVLRGPQSVYFGRSTLTGAVAYRTRNITDTWSGEFAGTFAQQGERDLEATIAGPVIPGLLKMRLTGLTQSYGGYVNNDYNNTELGAQQRNSISTTVIVTPAKSVEIKGYFNYFRDNDGPAATAFVPQRYDNCRLGPVKGTICGEVPDFTHSVNYSNTDIPALGQPFLFSTPVIRDAGFAPKIGTQRRVINSDIVLNWDINNWLKFTEITGYHSSIDISADDGFGQPPPANNALSPFAPNPYTIYMYTYSVKRDDFSQEVRFTSDPAKRLSFTLGGNYIDQTLSISSYLYKVPQLTPFDTFKQPIVPSNAKTYGIFGGLYFKVTDRLTVSAEGREQSDKISIPTASSTFTSFSPRVSADFDIGGHRKIYTSYAEGNLPGGFNTTITPYLSNPPVLAQIQSILGISTPFFKEEKLKIGEVGFKGNFMEGRGYLDVNGYYGELDGQQIRAAALIPLLGFSVSVTNNAGLSKLYGIEYQGDYNFDRHLSLSTTFAWNHTERIKYLNLAGVAQFGTTDFDGKQFAQVPVYSGSAVLSYHRELVNDLNGYGNVVVVYRGKQFADDFNAAYIPGRFQVDLRAGVTKGPFQFEGFVKNVLGDRNYTGGGVTQDFAPGAAGFAFFGAVAQPRQFGARILAKF